MTDLDEALNAAIRAGHLRYVSIQPFEGGATWQCNAYLHGAPSWRCVMAATPSEGLARLCAELTPPNPTDPFEDLLS